MGCLGAPQPQRRDRTSQQLARRCGVKVLRFSVGVGRAIRRRIGRDGTEYQVAAIPLGGYVKIVGMLPPDALDVAEEVEIDAATGNQIVRVRKSNTGMFTQLISDARAAEWELVKPEDADRLFYKMAWWKKVVVMAGGPSVNIAIAFFLFFPVRRTSFRRTTTSERPSTWDRAAVRTFVLAFSPTTGTLRGRHRSPVFTST